MDAEVEFLVAGSNRHLGVGLWIVSHARLEDNVPVIFESTYQLQILSQVTCAQCRAVLNILFVFYSVRIVGLIVK